MRTSRPKILLLHTLIDRGRDEKFVWGSNDCMIFTASIAAQVGVFDSSEVMSYAGTYSNKKGALDLVNKFGGFQNAMDYFFRNLEVINPRKALHGDVLLLDTPTGLSAAVCAGSVAVGPGDSGLEFVTIKKAIKAWAN